jgi:A/G-specific adenine glycosylase
MEKKFTEILMKWHKQHNSREMPWKGEKDPYKIWLSEIILQQTRVAQGWQYYTNFITRYPTIGQLAKAPDQEVFKLWEGLGYYNRCKNLLFTARQIVNEKNSIFPNQYEDLLALKGVGPYTAAAIASFAYNLPYAVVDGNVFRVLSRYFGIDDPIDSAKGKQVFTELAGKVLWKKEAGLYNQAIMDFGATVCKPFAPACSICPLQKYCRAFKEGRVNQLPVKEKHCSASTAGSTISCLNTRGKYWSIYAAVKISGRTCTSSTCSKRRRPLYGMKPPYWPGWENSLPSKKRR